MGFTAVTEVRGLEFTAVTEARGLGFTAVIEARGLGFTAVTEVRGLGFTAFTEVSGWGQPHLTVCYPINREMSMGIRHLWAYYNRDECGFFGFSVQSRDLIFEALNVKARNLKKCRKY